MKKELYSIGETAKIMGLSVQLLRHYCDIGLIQPEYINESTGYRFFSYEQFPYIDRTRYLLKCGLKLKEIKAILDEDDPDMLVALLNVKEQEKREELRRAQETVDTIVWYKDYFAVQNRELTDGLSAVVKTLPQRYMVAVPCSPEDSYEDIHIRLHEVRYRPEYKHLNFMRQFFAILDYPALLRGEFIRKYLGMYVQDPGDVELPCLYKLPAGEYYCFRAKVFDSGWNPYPVNNFFEDREPPSIVLANEYENSFRDYSGSIFELQLKL